jgi:hypothetical protein
MNGFVNREGPEGLQDAPCIGTSGKPKGSILSLQEPQHCQIAEVNLQLIRPELGVLGNQGLARKQPARDSHLRHRPQDVPSQPQSGWPGDCGRSQDLLNDAAALKYVVALPLVQPIELGAELIEGIPHLNAPAQELRNPVAEGEVSTAREVRIPRRSHSSFVAQH